MNIVLDREEEQHSTQQPFTQTLGKSREHVGEPASG